MSSRRSTLAIARLGVLFVGLITMGIVLVVSGTDGLRDVLTEVGESRWGVIAFVFAYAVAVVLLLPGTLGTLTAGAVFGFPLGAFVALAGATIGSTVAFLIARMLGREGTKALFGDRVTGIDDFIGRNDFASILVLRLMPIVPFNLLNYGAGVTSVRLSRYVAASIIGMAPGTFLATALADQADDPTGAPFLLLFAIFIVVLIGSVFVSRRIQPTRER